MTTEIIITEIMTATIIRLKMTAIMTQSERIKRDTAKAMSPLKILLFVDENVQEENAEAKFGFDW